MKTQATFRKPVFVVNPNSANGSTGREWRVIEEMVRRDFPDMHAVFTTQPYEAPSLVRRALHEGADLIVSVGGDGTHNEVINGFFESERPINREAALAVISRGTGGDFRRTLGLERCVGKDMPGAIASLGDCRVGPCDIGRLEFLNHAGERSTRYFLNITSFGIGGEVDEQVNRSTKIFGGKASFLIGTLRATLRYRNRNVRVLVDGNEIYEGKIYNVAVANGRYFGGGMMIAPNAEIDDGFFDIVICKDFHFGDALRLGNTVYSGQHVGHPKIEILRGKKVEAFSDERVLLDVDGEQPGRLDANFELVPHAIRVLRM